MIHAQSELNTFHAWYMKRTSTASDPHQTLLRLTCPPDVQCQTYYSAIRPLKDGRQSVSYPILDDCFQRDYIT